MATVASRVRKGTLSLKTSTDTNPVVFSCDPTSLKLNPAAGDTGDTLEVLCGDSIAGEPGPTTWTMDITSIQRVETTDTDVKSLALYALKNDGKKAAFVWKMGETTQTFYGNVRIVAIGIGGAVGGTAPTSDVSWPMDGPPSTVAPILLAVKQQAAA